MNETVFINEFISLGLAYFFDKKGDALFEGHIIECMCDIYGKDKLKQVYDQRDESQFISLVQSYGLQNSLYDTFIFNTNNYEKFKALRKNDLSLKSDVASKVESSIIIMYIFKCFILEPSLEELSHFENNLLNNFEIIKLHFNSSTDPNMTRRMWSKKKKLLEDNVNLVRIVPNYLDDFTYHKFGTSLEEVEKMDYRMVEELNSYITSKQTLEIDENPNDSDKRKINLFSNTALSSGNGYVDALLVASIIATEISIALIYLFLHL